MQLWTSSSFDSRSPSPCSDIVAGVDQLGENFRRVLVASSQPARDNVVEVFLEIGDRRDTGIELLTAENRFQSTKNGQRPSAQRPAFIVRDAKHLADQLDRNRRGKVGDEIDLAAAGGSFKQVVDELLDPALQRAERAGSECRCQQLTHTAVIGRIVEHEARGVMLVQ